MLITIYRNLTDLTDAEKLLLHDAKSFAHANDVLIVTTPADNEIWWQPPNAAAAYLYLKNELKVREL